ncbi:WD40 repeat-like protein [Glarea lozoyensis ATCC 20868]|uniref:WD40 repeat-like protein n=1 Tax=Glarea lozoyensis (strain ATCC 20868 / MF5171) TaxID=1116229 RepID=S3D1T8_GLAL2|nr:WD40 repeat-like protein [Glarea lozoyensis ATCC 20868]EPE26016.1 WD40 repeat-like protein [Glarea lozoyensis ATCC 20868]
MANSYSKPRVTKNGRKVQLSYELPHRIHTVKVYPIKSPNDSIIILYGHENGVRIVWRGGRPFKEPSETPTTAEKTNGRTNAVISLDSDDEGGPPKFEDKPEFEDEEDLDPSIQYPEILQTLDIHFGTPVLQLATLPSSVLKAEGASWQAFQPLQQKIIFAAGCADSSLKLVTLPTTPPSPISKDRSEFRISFTEAYAGKGNWGETVTSLTGSRQASAGISLTARVENTSSSSRSTPQIIVASHTPEVSGVLYMYKVSTKSPEAHLQPFQKIYLSSPAKSIAFNPSLDGQRSSHLLVADKKGACRIYDYAKLSTTSDEGTEGNVIQEGTWLLSLYTRFESPKSNQLTPRLIGSHTGFGRKPIVDAKWVAAGRAVIVLLVDGEWGVWDIEGAGPGASKGLLGPQGVKTGAISEYSLTGFIDAARKTQQSGPPQIPGKFIPSTPSASRSLALFGSKANVETGHGEISVMDISSSVSKNILDESIVFWLGQTYTQIPNLSKYWRANAGKNADKPSGNALNNASGSVAVRLNHVNLQGERCSGIDQIPTTNSGDLPTELIVLGEHRYIILSTPSISKQPKPRATSNNLALVARNSTTYGDLTVMDIDQELDKMEYRSSKRNKLF